MEVKRLGGGDLEFEGLRGRPHKQVLKQLRWTAPLSEGERGETGGGGGQ